MWVTVWTEEGKGKNCGHTYLNVQQSVVVRGDIDDDETVFYANQLNVPQVEVGTGTDVKCPRYDSNPSGAVVPVHCLTISFSNRCNLLNNMKKDWTGLLDQFSVQWSIQLEIEN